MQLIDCISQQNHFEVCAMRFDACLQVLADALAAGIDNFTSSDRANVKRAKKDLMISDTLAKECLATQVRHVLHTVKP